MTKLLNLCARYPLRVLLLIGLFSLIFAVPLPDLRIEVTPTSLVADSDPDARFHAETQRRFGATDVMVLALQDPDLFRPQLLKDIAEAVARIEALPFVDGSLSLFNLRDGHNEEGELRFRAYLDPLPETPEAARAIPRQALGNPFIAGNLLSADGRTLAVNIRLKPEAATDREIAAAVEAAVAPLRERVDTLFVLGTPQVDAALSDYIVRDQQRIVPMALGALLLVLWLALGRFQVLVMPLSTALLSVLWILGFMAWLDIPLHVLTAIVPALLLIVGSTEDVHLLAAYLAARGEGDAPREAIERMARHTGLAVFLTFLTTYLGFLSVGLNEVRYLREFGLVASTGLLFNFVITVTLIPALLALLPDRGKGFARSRENLFLELANWSFRHFARYPLRVLAGASLLGLVALYAASGLRVDSDTLGYLPGDAPIHEQARFLHRELAGIGSLEVVVDSRIEGTFQRLRYLEQVQRLQQFLQQDDRFDKVLSLVDYAMLLNRLMDGRPDDPLELPVEDYLLQEFLALAGREQVRPLVNEDYSRLRLLVRHGLTGSDEVLAAVRDIENFAAGHLDSALAVRVTGSSYLSALAADSLAVGQAQSLLLMLLVIFLLVALLFVDLRAGLIALLPNLLPVLIVFAVMALAGVPLNTGTAMVAAIAVGISIDDTMHFLVRYRQEMRQSPSYRLAVFSTLEEEVRPILSTSVALAMGFGVLWLSSFPPVAHFGALSALVMLLALLTNLILTPALLVFVRLSTAWDLLEAGQRQRLVSGSTLFRGLNGYQVRKLMAISRQQDLRDGERLLLSGSRSQLCLVLDGALKAADGVRHEGGDLLGLGSLAPGGGRDERLVCQEYARVLWVDPEELERLGRILPRTAARVCLNLARAAARDKTPQPNGNDDAEQD
jgi:predicted RND superfamily exporter protein